MAEGSDTERGVWAIVTAGGRRLIGRVRERDTGWTEVTLFPTYELTTFTQPVQDPHGNIVIRRQTVVFPYDSCLHDVQVHLSHPAEVTLLEELHSEDRRRYDDLIEACQKEQTANRAQEAGLHVAGPGFDPTRFRGGLVGPSRS